MSRMNVVAPERSEYLASAAGRKMSFYRQKSLSRAAAYRSVLVKRDGSAAANQYGDDYLSKADVKRTVQALSLIHI